MRVALIAAPYIAVPPTLYGGAERRINVLVNHLAKNNIDVTLFASGDSKPSVPLRAICDIALSQDKTYNHLRDMRKKLKKINERTLQLIQEDKYDLINTHDYENLDLTRKLSNLNTPIVFSVRHSLTPLIQEVYDEFKDHSNIYFHGVSQTQVNALNPEMHFINHGEEISHYKPIKDSCEKRAYFFSIGDMKPSKGHSIAIRLAKKIGLDLVISGGSLYYPASEHYFEGMIKPKIDKDVFRNKKAFLEGIVNGTHTFKRGEIINFGPSNDEEKKILYRYALFTQFLGNLELRGSTDACPGTVIESLLSGTAILGTRGSASEELVEEGVTGLNVSSLEEAASKIDKIASLHPKQIRLKAIKRYSGEIMAKNYISLYEKVLGGMRK